MYVYMSEKLRGGWHDDHDEYDDKAIENRKIKENMSIGILTYLFYV